MIAERRKKNPQIYEPIGNACVLCSVSTLKTDKNGFGIQGNPAAEKKSVLNVRVFAEKRFCIYP